VRRIRGNITYSNVVSSLCLVLLIGGGTAYAASHLGKESVGARQLKKGAVTPAKLAKATTSQLTGPAGPRGPAGTPGLAGEKGERGLTGAPGSARAWAVVAREGRLLHGTGFTKVTVTSNIYCAFLAPGIDLFEAAPVITPFGAAAEPHFAVVDPGGCGSGQGLEITIFEQNGGTSTRVADEFFVAVP
jgi:hypothetical protein